MRYDKVSDFIRYLAENIKTQGYNDAVGEETILSLSLYSVAERLYEAAEEMDSVWKERCKSYMEVK